MINRRTFLRLLPGVVAVSFAATPAHGQYGYPEPTPPPTLTMEQVSSEVATLKMQMGVGLAALRAMSMDMRKIWKHLGNPGPHAERLENT
jgi:hypothetical protein